MNFKGFVAWFWNNYEVDEKHHDDFEEFENHLNDLVEFKKYFDDLVENLNFNFGRDLVFILLIWSMRYTSIYKHLVKVV